MRPISYLVLAITFAPLRSAGAQQTGEPVRLVTRGPSSQHLVGMLVGQDADSFWVQPAGRVAPVAVARGAVAGLEISRGHKRWVSEGAAFGAGLGAIGGFVRSGVRASRSQPCGGQILIGACSVAWYGDAFRGGLVAGAIGGAMGAALGYVVRTERWEGVPLSRAHSLTLAPRGAGLAVSLSF